MYDFPGKVDYYKIVLKVKCFNDDCDNILVHDYPSYSESHRIDGDCPKCKQGYSRKVYNLDENRIVNKTSIPVYV
ncbi:hypothetical protein YDYSY3_39260 [Paenibacillus chitinolyticus]|nr:hypothetical protein YDYSY3_39260 [Paenibacillus chitinolyticus]